MLNVARLGEDKKRVTAPLMRATLSFAVPVSVEWLRFLEVHPLCGYYDEIELLFFSSA